jgi:lysophosphatidylcholine acyltransferase/lyso-PAF acetyltransferase
MKRRGARAAQGTTTNGACLLPFKTGAFLAGAPVRPVVLEYGADRVSAAWESINFVWHALLMLANARHSVTAYEVRGAARAPGHRLVL